MVGGVLRMRKRSERSRVEYNLKLNFTYHFHLKCFPIYENISIMTASLMSDVGIFMGGFKIDNDLSFRGFWRLSGKLKRKYTV